MGALRRAHLPEGPSDCRCDGARRVGGGHDRRAPRHPHARVGRRAHPHARRCDLGLWRLGSGRHHAHDCLHRHQARVRRALRVRPTGDPLCAATAWRRVTTPARGDTLQIPRRSLPRPRRDRRRRARHRHLRRRPHRAVPHAAGSGLVRPPLGPHRPRRPQWSLSAALLGARAARPACLGAACKRQVHSRGPPFGHHRDGLGRGVRQTPPRHC
mmetsp:Transcript_1063/g.2278  ORF Transcript_1063/g.2278 Transcript_1063/m.2278 type:complete len:213 (+) Transcript_1063:1031-1669(+)